MLSNYRSILLTLFLTFPAFLPAQTPSADLANVYIISPTSGESVSSPLTVQFGLSGMGIAPAGVEQKNTGHHHLLIDAKDLPAKDKPIPKDDQHIHFGGGQTETTIELSPGEHTLQLVLGDQNHIPLEPMVASEKITITVK